MWERAKNTRVVIFKGTVENKQARAGHKEKYRHKYVLIDREAEEKMEKGKEQEYF